MRTFSFIMCIALLFLCGQQAAQAQKVKLEETPQGIVQHESEVLDEGKVMIVVDADKVSAIRNLLDYLLEHGRADVADGLCEEASHEFEMAAAYMHLDAGRGKSKASEEVVAAANDIERLGTLIAENSDTPLDVIDSQIFAAHRALAYYHQQRAAFLFDAGYYNKAGLALEAALVHYENAARSHARMKGIPMDEKIGARVDAWDKEAKLLKESLHEVPDKAEQTIYSLEKAIESLDK